MLNRWHLSTSVDFEVPITDKLWWRSVFPLAYEAETHAPVDRQRSEEVLLSFIYKESAFSPRAISPLCNGLMQLLKRPLDHFIDHHDPISLIQKAVMLRQDCRRFQRVTMIITFGFCLYLA